jgi:uncharacterized protein (DUF1778 family)
MKSPNPEFLTSTISVRLTDDERRLLEHGANQEHRTVSNFVRKQLRSHPSLDLGPLDGGCSL